MSGIIGVLNMAGPPVDRGLLRPMTLAGRVWITTHRARERAEDFRRRQRAGLGMPAAQPGS